MHSLLRSSFPIAALIAQCLASKPEHSIDHWLYSSEIDNATVALLHRSDIAGVQALYSWKSLEPSKDQYDFSAIRNDLELAEKLGKQLWVQLQDRTFSPAYSPVPKYLHEPIYNNGSVPMCDGDDCDENFKVGGWLTAQWNRHVRERFQSLLKAMSHELDGHIYGLNLAETAVEVRQSENNFTCQGYFDGTLENAKYAADVFDQSFAVQYVNFWPCGWANENNYLSDSFDFFAEHNVGVGGPDNIPYAQGQEDNAYPYMSDYRDTLPINVIAVQEPDLEKINPNTSKPFTKQEFTDFAVDRLGAKIIFWATSSPWLY